MWHNSDLFVDIANEIDLSLNNAGLSPGLLPFRKQIVLKR